MTECTDHGDHLPPEGTTGRQQRDEEKVAGGPRFDPPVYVQRYTLVQNVLQEHQVESVVDFGSAECKIVHWLKCVDSAQRLFLVDIDEEVLLSHRAVIKPLTTEHLFRRPTPLTIAMLQGSAGDLDRRVVGCQAASLVEIIEHLEPDMLRQVTDCVFGRLRPSLIIVTTPNADFNVLFPNFTGFRHWDHKFEWTREEFHQWCDDVCLQHGYSVRYTGVGDPPSDMTHLGCCSQAAIFTETAGKPGESTDKEVYRLVQEVVYPVDQRTPAQQLANEVDCLVNSFCRLDKYLSTEDRMLAVIPIADVTDHMMLLAQKKSNQRTSAEVIEYIQSKHTLSEDGSSMLIQLHSNSSSDSLDEEDHEDQDDDRSAKPPALLTEEDWG